MARKRTRTRRRAAPAAIVVRQTAPIARAAPRRRSPQRVIVGRVRRRRSKGGGGGAFGGLNSRGWQALEGATTTLAAAALGWAEANNHAPPRVAGVDTLTAGSIVVGLVPVIWPRSRVARVIGAAATGTGAVAAYKLATGQLDPYLSAADRERIQAQRRASGEWEEDDD